MEPLPYNAKAISDLWADVERKQQILREHAETSEQLYVSLLEKLPKGHKVFFDGALDLVVTNVSRLDALPRTWRVAYGDDYTTTYFVPFKGGKPFITLQYKD
jgi:hypothetical protein